jgi:hypothetical protein
LAIHYIKCDSDVGFRCSTALVFVRFWGFLFGLFFLLTLHTL